MREPRIGAKGGYLTGGGGFVRTSTGSSVALFPATAAGLASALGDATALASEILLCQEASGNLTGSITAATYTASGTPAYSTATGGWDDRVAVSFTDASSDRFAGSDADLLGDDNSKALMAVFRVPTAPAGSNMIMSKRGVTLSKGLDMGVFATGKAFVEVSTTTQATTNVVSDNAWHVCIVMHNKTLNLCEIYTDVDAAGFTKAVTASTDNAGFLTLGDNPHILNACGVDIAYAAAFEGAAAEALNQTLLDSFWATHAL